METIATFCGKGALHICWGAKAHRFKTVLFCDNPFYKKFKTRILSSNVIGVIDEILNKEDVVNFQGVVIPNEEFLFWKEKIGKARVFGNVEAFKGESYQFLKGGNLKIPKRYAAPQEIDKPVVVKFHEGKKRKFFIATSYDEYLLKAQGKNLENVIIEEFIRGVEINAYFFYSRLTDELEFFGVDERRLSEIDGLARLAMEDNLFNHNIPYGNQEVASIPMGIDEDLLEEFFSIGEKILSNIQQKIKWYEGPIVLESIVNGEGEIFIHDLLLHFPRYNILSPEFLYRKRISLAERIAIEIRKAINEERLEEITSSP